MKLFLKRNSPVFYMLLAMIVLYAPWMGRGYVNLEYPFSMAARALSDSRYAGQIDSYFSIQANPLGYSFVLAIIYKIFGYHDWFWLAKLPSLCGALMILISGWILTRDRWHGRRSLFYFWSSLIILNPLFIAFATSSTADVLHIGLLMLAIAIAYENRGDSWARTLIAALIFGLAIITKYIPMYFGLAFIAIACLKPGMEKRPVKIVRRDIATYVLVPGLILFIYIWWLYDKYSVFISSGLAPSKPSVTIKQYFIVLGKYLMFLGLCCGPISISIAIKYLKRKNEILFGSAVLVTAIVVGSYLSRVNLKEMGFAVGFPLGIVVSQCLEIFGFIMGISICLAFYRIIKLADRLKLVLCLGAIPALLLMSVTIPRQRYVMIFVPSILLLLVDASSVLTVKIRNLILGLTAIGFAAVSLLGVSYLRAQGNAAENMATWMEQNRLINKSSAFPISVHAGQHFDGITSSEIKYEVIQTSLEGEKLIKERVLHREPMNVLGRITRVYVLRELPKAP